MAPKCFVRATPNGLLAILVLLVLLPALVYSLDNTSKKFSEGDGCLHPLCKKDGVGENVLGKYFSRFQKKFWWVSASQSDQCVWPELKFDWRIVIGTIIGFFGAALGSVGGVGGGGIFVPMLNLIIGFDVKSSVALSQCMILSTSASALCHKLKRKHPSKNLPIIDYELALLFQPMLLIGITIGVALNITFANWMITFLLAILFLVASVRSCLKGTQAWNQETIQKAERHRQILRLENEVSDNIAGEYRQLASSSRREVSIRELFRLNIHWKATVLFSVWGIFLALKVLQYNSTRCGLEFWTYNALQIPVALGVTAYEGAILSTRAKQIQDTGNQVDMCSPPVEWTIPQFILSACLGITAGVVGGLLGLGGGYIMGPVFLALGVMPQVSNTTATFIMLFSSSLSVVENYFLHRFPIPYALYLGSISILAGLSGQYIVRRLVLLLGRSSPLIIIISGATLASALTMGDLGISRAFQMLEQKEFMGFLSFCKVP